MDILRQVQEYLDWGIEQRRELHTIPELGRSEFKTAAYCKNVLSSLGFDIKESFSTGFTADLAVDPSYRMIAFRADMDALPAQEISHRSYCSLHDGVAHLCGHDVHMAVLLTAARFMADHRDDLKYNIRLLLQPSEEMFVGGAKGMIEAGCLDGVDEVFGLHNDPTKEAGSIHLCQGAISSNGDNFDIQLKGKSVHASAPDQGLDTIRESCRLITEFNNIVANNCSPMQPALISVGTLRAGEASNIIPDHAELSGSVRSFDAKTQQIMLDRINLTLNESRQRGFSTQLDIRGYPSIINSKEGYDRVLEAGRQTIGIENIEGHCKPMAGSEDFSYFLNERGGAFFFLGSGNKEKGITNPIHSNPFDVDENCIAVGAAVFVALSLN